MDATTYGELEIGLHRWNIDSYSAELRFSQDESANGESTAPAIDTDIIDVRVLRGIQFDFDALRANALDPISYGRALTASVFADPRLQTAFTVACTRAQERNQKLRLRLFIGPSAPELHALRWETLRDPRSPDDSWLVSSEHIHFSRYLTTFGYLSGEGWQRVRLRPQCDGQIDRTMATSQCRETSTLSRSLHSAGGRENNEPSGVFRPKPKMRRASGLLAKRQVKR